MKIFTLYIEDDRYSVPTLFTAELRDDAAAMTHAEELLVGAPHYRSVEIWDGDRLIGKVDARSDRDRGEFVVHRIHEDAPFDAPTRAAVDTELESLANWLGLALAR